MSLDDLDLENFDFDGENINPKTVVVSKLFDFQLKGFLKRASLEEKHMLLRKAIEEGLRNTDNMNIIIQSLDEEEKIQYIDYYNFKRYDAIKDFVEGMRSEENIYYAAKFALDQVSKYPARVSEAFSVVPQSKKQDFLRLIALKEKEIKRDIIDYDVTFYLRSFKLEDRLSVVKNILFQDFQREEYAHAENGEKYVYKVRIDQFYYKEILKAFSDEEATSLEESKMYECFKFLCNECKKIKNSDLSVRGLSSPSWIVDFFIKQGYSPNKILEDLLNNELIGSSRLFSCIEVLPTKFQKDACEYIIRLDNDKRIIDKYNFFYFLNDLPKATALELFTKYCIDERKYDYLYFLNAHILSNYTLDYLNIIFTNLPEEEINRNFEDIKYCFNYYSLHLLESSEYDEKYMVIVNGYAKQYNIDVNKLLAFVQKFSYEVLEYLENENLQKIVNMDDISRDRLFSLFTRDTIKLDKGSVNDILNAFLQREFRLEEGSAFNIFATFQDLIRRGESSEVENLLNNILTDYGYEKVLKGYNCSLEDLCKQISDQISKGNLDLLHEITNKYIAYRREKFVNGKLLHPEELLQMDEVITKESYLEVLVQEGSDYIIQKCKLLTEVDFTEDQQRLINNFRLMDKIIAFKRNPQEYQLSPEYKKYLLVLKELAGILYDNLDDYKNYKADDPKYKNLKFDFMQGEISNEFLVGILMEANYEGLIGVLQNDEYYNSLKEFLTKYKIMGWQDIFAKIAIDADIQLTESTIASLMCNFDNIGIGRLTETLDKANSRSSDSNYFRSLFGLKVYLDIAVDPGPNQSTLSKSDKLNVCRDLVREMFKRDAITTPPINKTYSLNNGKNIRIVLGNTANMENLTLGEKTGACMRAGGIFDNLFKHCLTDRNGFHICLLNPKTGELISRVSGTRNGNTVFLNELRDSLDSNYDDEDLYETIKMVANEIVELSKDSSLPIDNVLITSDFALTGHQQENQNLQIFDIEEAFREVQLSYGKSGILLANSKNDNKIVPYVFTEDVPEYEPVRGDVNVYYGTRATDKILQIRAINNLVNGNPPEDEVLEYIGEIPDFVIGGEDYYIAYKNGEILETYVLDSRKNNKRTIEEIEKVNEKGLKEGVKIL